MPERSLHVRRRGGCEREAKMTKPPDETLGGLMNCHWLVRPRFQPIVPDLTQNTGRMPVRRRNQAPSGASLRPAARLRLIILRPLVVFMRLRKPWRRLRVLRLQRLGYAMPMGMISGYE